FHSDFYFCPFRFRALACEEKNRKRWQSEVKRVRSSVRGNLFCNDTSEIPHSAASIEDGIAVQFLRPIAAPRNADPVGLPRHGRKVANDEHSFKWRFSETHKADDAAIVVVAIDPLETFPVVIHFVKFGMCPIEVEQIV